MRWVTLASLSHYLEVDFPFQCDSNESEGLSRFIYQYINILLNIACDRKCEIILQYLPSVKKNNVCTDVFSPKMSSLSAASVEPTPAIEGTDEKKPLKPCCACPETKKVRDAW